MKFYKNFIRSFTDLPNHHSLIIHSLVGCNLDCYHCHNKAELSNVQEFKTEEDVINELELSGYIFDAVIFSGGEFLLDSTESIINFLRNVRKVFKGKIIINTNGTFPEKVRKLLDYGLVDGFHVDMKLPFHSETLKTEDIEKIIGFKLPFKAIKNILSTIGIVVQHNSEYSQIRTVKYDIVPIRYFVEIEKYIFDLNTKYNSNIKYYINDFIKNP